MAEVQINCGPYRMYHWHYFTLCYDIAMGRAITLAPRAASLAAKKAAKIKLFQLMTGHARLQGPFTILANLFVNEKQC